MIDSGGVSVMSGMNRYYEDLVFDSGSKINVSRQVNNDYFDTVHWHPYVELLVSRCDGNRATVNFSPYQLNKIVNICLRLNDKSARPDQFTAGKMYMTDRPRKHRIWTKP